MNFWIYENWRADDKTVIHKENCNCCNYGHGTGKGTCGEKNGRWHGPFTSFNNAKTEANKLKRKKHLECQRCKPS